MNRLVHLLLIVGCAAAHPKPSGVNQTLPHLYHAQPRHVPTINVDFALKLQFLQLFRSSNSTARTSSDTNLKPATIKHINQLCPRDEFFYTFAPRHVNATNLLQAEFMSQPTPRDVFNLASGTLRSKAVNPRVWYNALTLTFLQRPDMNGYQLAWPSDVTPDSYLPNSHINQANSSSNSNTCVPYQGTEGATSSRENLLWYFREDFMLNQHHFNWHQYFPLNSQNGRHPDRRGEQFYFMHHQIIARYNAERLSNGLDLVSPLNLSIRENIGSGYKSDMIDKTSGLFWADRAQDVRLSDIYHGNDKDFELNITMQEISELYRTLVNHISKGFLMNNQSQEVNVKNQLGMSYFGDTMEASEQLSLNPILYNDFGVHNLAHIAVGLAQDPKFEKGLPSGVIGDQTVTMRDPAFYRIHGMVDKLFDEHKITLEPYELSFGEWPLKMAGVEITKLEVNGGKGMNLLQTFWRNKRFPLEEGLDGRIHGGYGKVRDICHKHLDHDRFRISLEVEVSSSFKTNSNKGNVRIFMAPRNNLDGRRMGMNETRELMFQLDVFPVELKRGRNVITRNSRDSSLTKPWSRSLKEMLADPGNGGKPDYCGCGIPDHLFIPKGNANGMEFDFFAMITDFDQDVVKDSVEDLKIPEPCNSPYLLCNIPYRKYPDKRPMGYPFDTFPYQWRSKPVNNLEEYVDNVPNMISSTVTVQHVNRVIN